MPKFLRSVELDAKAVLGLNWHLRCGRHGSLSMTVAPVSLAKAVSTAVDE